IARNQGNRTFTYETIQLPTSLSGYTWDLQTADLNGDGLPDIIGTDNSSRAVYVVRSQFVAPLSTFTIAPRITAVTGPANGAYRAGQNLDFPVTFSSPVTVTGTPQIPLMIGTAARAASYLAGSGTNTLTFRYTVASGDNDSDGISVASPINLNGGTIK